MYISTCGMIVSFLRSLYKAIWLISTSSMMIWPLEGSMSLNNDKVKDDLPAPVRPTTPIY